MDSNQVNHIDKGKPWQPRPILQTWRHDVHILFSDFNSGRSLFFLHGLVRYTNRKHLQGTCTSQNAEQNAFAQNGSHESRRSQWLSAGRLKGNSFQRSNAGNSRTFQAMGLVYLGLVCHFHLMMVDDGCLSLSYDLRKQVGRQFFFGSSIPKDIIEAV